MAPAVVIPILLLIAAVGQSHEKTTWGTIPERSGCWEHHCTGGKRMTTQELLAHVSADPAVCGGMPCVRGTRIPIAVILDGMAEGLTPEQLLDHFPSLTPDDVRAALAYAAELSRETIWKIPTDS